MALQQTELNNIISAIKEEKPFASIQVLLEDFLHHDLTPVQREAFLCVLIRCCHLWQQTHIVKWLLQDQKNSFLDLLISPHLTDEIRVYLLQCQKYNWEKYCVDLLKLAPTHAVVVQETITQIIDFSFCFQKEQDFVYAKQKIPINSILRQALKKQLQKYYLAFYRPAWIKTESCELSPYEDNLPDTREACQRLWFHMCQQKIFLCDNLADEKLCQKRLRAQYSLAPLQDKINLIQPCSVQQFVEKNDNNYFRHYGPVNTSYDLVPEECTQYGGCRMLLCCHREYYAEDEEFATDGTDDCPLYSGWFTGQCMKCNRHIPRCEYALRLPMYRGGWRGCYCSFACVTAGSYQETSDKKREIIPEMLSYLKEQIFKYGIQERAN